MPMCLSRVLLGLESSARARSCNHRSRSGVCESSIVGGCKYERYVRYVSTDEHTLVTTLCRKLVDYVERSCSFVMHLCVKFCKVICEIFPTISPQ